MKKILIVSANPIDTDPLRLDQEAREIKEGLRLSRDRDLFKIEQEWAVRTKDLRRALLNHRPQIVHFCGHGEVSGILLEDNNGRAALVSQEALAKLFKLFEKDVECVVLNACLSWEQAEAISEHINYVVGMSKEVGDAAAIEFAVGFYDALGAGEPYARAFEFGTSAIELEGLNEEDTPQLFEKPGAAEAVENKEEASSQVNVPPEKQPLYNLYQEKISRLKTAFALETDAARKMQIEYQIQETEKDMQKMLAG